MGAVGKINVRGIWGEIDWSDETLWVLCIPVGIEGKLEGKNFSLRD